MKNGFCVKHKRSVLAGTDYHRPMWDITRFLKASNRIIAENNGFGNGTGVAFDGREKAPAGSLSVEIRKRKE